MFLWSKLSEEIKGGHKKHGHKKQIVWKHGPNWPFYALILEAIRLYQASQCKQTKEQGSEDCLWTRIFTFL